MYTVESVIGGLSGCGNPSNVCVVSIIFRRTLSVVASFFAEYTISVRFRPLIKGVCKRVLSWPLTAWSLGRLLLYYRSTAVFVIIIIGKFLVHLLREERRRIIIVYA